MRTERYRVNGLHIRLERVGRGSSEWIGVAKRDPFFVPRCSVLREPGHVWIGFASHKGDLIAQLLWLADRDERIMR